MERQTPTIDQPSPPAPSLGEGSAAVPASVDAEAALRLASSLRRRPGHVVVTAPFSTTAARLFEMAEAQLGTTRVVRLSARLLVESEVARALAGVVARGLPPPSPAAVGAVVEEAHRQNQSIVVLVEDADAVQVERLDHVREMLGRTAAMREVVRLVLLGSGPLRRMLETPEAKAFADAVALHLDVSSAEPMTLAASPRSAAPRRARPPRAPSRLVNEKLLVLAVGAVLVTGVLLFPIEPTVYPPPPDVAAPAVAPTVAAPTVPIVSAPVAPSAGEPAAGTGGIERPVGDAAATTGDVADPAATPADTSRRFRPPARPGPALQVGAFRDRENAVRLAERLDEDFDGVYIDQLGEGSASLHRVRVAIPGTVLGESNVARALVDRGLDPVRVE